MRNAFCIGLMALSVAAVVGCESSLGPTANKGTERTVLAATAGGSQYPRDIQVSGDLPIVALMKGDGDITLVNPTDEAYNDLKVWINETHVQPVDHLAPKSMLTLKRGSFYDSKGYAFAKAATPVNSVVIQTGDNRLLRVYGPVTH